MHIKSRTFFPLLALPLLALLLLALVTAASGWVAGGVVAVLALLLLSGAFGRRWKRRGTGSSGGDGGAGLYSWGGDSGCASGDGGGDGGGGCGGE